MCVGGGAGGIREKGGSVGGVGRSVGGSVGGLEGWGGLGFIVEGNR